MSQAAFATFLLRGSLTLLVALTLAVRTDAEVGQPGVYEDRIQSVEMEVLRLKTAALETRHKR